MKTKINGEERIVQEGDIVPVSQMSSFVYDQVSDQCTTENEDNCQDTFAYVPLSSW